MSNQLLETIARKIDVDYVLSTACKLVQIPSENPPGDESKVGEFILQQLRLFKNVSRVTTIEPAPNRVNILAWIEGTRQDYTCLFNGHMDVVPAGSGWSVPPYGGLIKENRLWGRGACDMKGALAAFLGVIKFLHDTRFVPSVNLCFSFVADEENGGALGTSFLLEQDVLHADMAIVGEPSNFSLSIGENGVAWITVCIHGSSGHTIYYYTKINPIEKAIGVLLALREVAKWLTEFYSPTYGRPILSINVIQSGTKINIIPNNCVIQADLRLPPQLPITIMDVCKAIKEKISYLQQQDPNFKYSLNIHTVANPFCQEPSIPPVLLIRRAYKLITGSEPSWWVRESQIPKEDSDMYHLWVKGKIPTVYFGPGEVELAHAPNESIALADLILAAKVFAAAACLAEPGTK
jgi:acetylornithine deacetylase/succinyl-diaminopimelate desuccinylase-like protein